MWKVKPIYKPLWGRHYNRRYICNVWSFASLQQQQQQLSDCSRAMSWVITAWSLRLFLCSEQIWRKETPSSSCQLRIPGGKLQIIWQRVLWLLCLLPVSALQNCLLLPNGQPLLQLEEGASPAPSWQILTSCKTPVVEKQQCEGWITCSP